MSSAHALFPFYLSILIQASLLVLFFFSVLMARQFTGFRSTELQRRCTQGERVVSANQNRHSGMALMASYRKLAEVLDDA
ncbi:hypothetical protein BDZ88DRAFT_405106 [Geranomyces variabilis]|nr:hypothetical protein BDZ88DRAFT_405106 [Geranomyces variabilis]